MNLVHLAHGRQIGRSQNKQIPSWVTLDLFCLKFEVWIWSQFICPPLLCSMSRSLISITPLRRGYIIPSKRTSSTAQPYKFLPFKEDAELHRISPRFLLYPQGYHLNQREHHLARPINRSWLHNPCLHEAWAVVGGSVQTWDCMDTTWNQDGMHNQGKSNECIGNMCKTSDSIKIEHIICRLIHLWWCNNATQTKSVETGRLVQWVAPAHTFFICQASTRC